jgi:hypothetical protein
MCPEPRHTGSGTTTAPLNAAHIYYTYAASIGTESHFDRHREPFRKAQRAASIGRELPRLVQRAASIDTESRLASYRNASTGTEVQRYYCRARLFGSNLSCPYKNASWTSDPCPHCAPFSSCPVILKTCAFSIHHNGRGHINRRTLFPRDASSKGCIIEGTHHSRTHCPRDASSKGCII